MMNLVLSRKPRLLILAIIVFAVAFIWSASNDIPQLGTGLFLILFILEIIFLPLTDLVYNVVVKIFKIFRRNS